MFTQILRPSSVQLVALWEESEHARKPKGPEGGQFTREAGGLPEGVLGRDDRLAMQREDPSRARLEDIRQVNVALTAEAQRAAPGITNRSILQRAKMKAQIQKDLTARLIHHPAFAGMEPRPPMNLEPVSEWVKGQIDLWADTSGDHSNPAIRMQQAVQQEFGLTDAAMGHLGATPKNADELARDRAFVRAEYERTQEWLAANHITHVSLYRGMSDDDHRLGSGGQVVTMQPASSWSTDLETAIDFANGEMTNPVVMTSRVPASQVLSTCVTGRGCLAETEFILLGKRQRVQSFPYDVHKARAEDKRAILQSLL